MNCNYETNPRPSHCPDPIAAVARLGGCSLVLPFRRGFPWAGGLRGCWDNFTLNLLLIARGGRPIQRSVFRWSYCAEPLLLRTLLYRSCAFLAVVKNSEHTPSTNCKLRFLCNDSAFALISGQLTRSRNRRSLLAFQQ